jgi:predicted O-methyltransferase YrrM
MVDTTKTNPEVIENRIHRDHEANPRKWPHGNNRVPAEFRSTAMAAALKAVKGIALLEEREQELIYHLVSVGGSGDYANLGHSQGASAILFAAALIAHNFYGKVESIDLFEPSRIYKRALQRLVSYPIAAERINLCLGPTSHFADIFNGRDFRGVFVDADHSYEAVKKDAISWMPLVGRGGFICFHDTHQDFSHRAVEETVASSTEFTERKDLHVFTIRVFVRK